MCWRNHNAALLGRHNGSVNRRWWWRRSVVNWRWGGLDGLRDVQSCLGAWCRGHVSVAGRWLDRRGMRSIDGLNGLRRRGYNWVVRNLTAWLYRWRDWVVRAWSWLHNRRLFRAWSAGRRRCWVRLWRVDRVLRNLARLLDGRRRSGVRWIRWVLDNAA